MQEKRRHGCGSAVPRRVALLAAAAMLVLAGGAVAADSGRGRQLYENQCLACHESTVHVREHHKVTKAAELWPTVERWQANASLLWNDADVDDVACYLNRAFYHFHQSVTGNGSGC